MTRKSSLTPPAVNVDVTLRGHVPARMRDYAVEKIGHVAAHTRAPVQTIHVVLDLVADPARERRSLAEAVIDVDGTPVPAHVAADQPEEAVDLLATGCGAGWTNSRTDSDQAPAAGSTRRPGHQWRGGSAGDPGLAHESIKIRDAVIECSRDLAELPFYILPGVGLEAEKEALPPNVTVLSDFDQMAAKLRTCALLVARAGRGAAAEALALRKRAVLIPTVGSNVWRAAEQAHNAQAASVISPGRAIHLSRLRFVRAYRARVVGRGGGPS
jgi:hypothetical protein